MAFSYEITCNDCAQKSWAREIVDLIANHSDKRGHLVCSHCKSTNAFIFRESKLQEIGEKWSRYIKAVIPIETGVATYTPYVFLTTEDKNGDITGVHFHYFKDTRAAGGRLKHGHGPGGPPVLSKEEIFQLIRKLCAFGYVTSSDLESLLSELKQSH